MSNLSRLLVLAGLLLAVCASPPAGAAHADPRHGDPSGRAARVSDVRGEVSYSPAGEDDWTDVVRNRPLVRGDRLWTDGNARAELQVGNAAIRLGADTNFEILALNDRIAQVRLTEGTLNLRVGRLYAGQSYEVATPMLAFVVSRAGRYRIDVGRRGDHTTVVVWEGAGEAHGERSRFPLRAGEAVSFYGDDLRDHEAHGLPRADAFDRYCVARDRRLDRSASRRYLDDDVVGYADLDDYGRWRPVRGYGTLWFPSQVDASWAPYRDGHWVWQEPWGWTWVDNAPWGFAPSHYGRWVYVTNRWGWMPGPRNVRPVYAPALVAFVGGRGWSVSLSLGQAAPVGWFPLAPREVYVPSYPASREYFTRVNVTNTVVNNTTITNVYNNSYVHNSTAITSVHNSTTYGDNSPRSTVTEVNYANRAVAGAVTAVPRSVFVNAQPVRPAALRVEAAAVATADVMRVAPVAPTARSVRGSGEAATARPSREALDRRVVARSAPPPAEIPFAAREQELQRTPGQTQAPAAAPAPAPVQAAPVEPAAVGAAHGRDRVRVVAEQPGAVDARAAGSRRAGRGARADRGPLPPLERAPEDALSATAAEKQRAETKGHEQRQRKAESEQQALKEAQADRERQVAAQHQAEQQRLAQEQEKQRQGKAESEQRQMAEQQRIERERLAAQQQQEQRRLKAEGDAQVAEQRRAEAKEQEQRQRKAEGEQQAAREAQAGRQRQSEREQQAAAQHRVEQQKLEQEQQQDRRDEKTAGGQRQATENQRVERERLAEKQQQEQRALKADGDARAAQQQERAERQRVADLRKLEMAECERRAVEKKQDKRQCRDPADKAPRKGNSREAAPGGD